MRRESCGGSELRKIPVNSVDQERLQGGDELELYLGEESERSKEEGGHFGRGIYHRLSYSHSSLEFTKSVHMCNLISSSLGCRTPEVLSHLRVSIV